MKFAENRPVKIIMLGAGGTGGHIAPHLYRLLYALERPVRFIICDGDNVEEKNLVRQNFTPADLGENKAKVLAERYSSVFGMETEYVPEFIESGERLLSMLRARTFPTGPYWHSPTVKELVILIGAVDNNKILLGHVGHEMSKMPAFRRRNGRSRHRHGANLEVVPDPRPRTNDELETTAAAPLQFEGDVLVDATLGGRIVKVAVLVECKADGPVAQRRCDGRCAKHGEEQDGDRTPEARQVAGGHEVHGRLKRNMRSACSAPT